MTESSPTFVGLGTLLSLRQPASPIGWLPDDATLLAVNLAGPSASQANTATGTAVGPGLGVPTT